MQHQRCKKAHFWKKNRRLIRQNSRGCTMLTIRARPVGAGIPVMDCVRKDRAIVQFSSNMYLTESVEGSTPLNKCCDSISQCIERGSRWLAFFLPKEKLAAL